MMECTAVAPEDWNPAEFGLTPAPDTSVIAVLSAKQAHDIAAIDRQAAGVIRLVPINPATWPATIAASDLNDPLVYAVSHLVGSTLADMEADAPHCLRRCTRCALPLRPSAFHLVAAVPDCPVPDSGLVLGVCAACGRGDWLWQAAYDALRAIWPDLRRLPIAALHPTTLAGELH